MLSPRPRHEPWPSPWPWPAPWIAAPHQRLSRLPPQRHRVACGERVHVQPAPWRWWLHRGSCGPVPAAGQWMRMRMRGLHHHHPPLRRRRVLPEASRGAKCSGCCHEPAGCLCLHPVWPRPAQPQPQPQPQQPRHGLHPHRCCSPGRSVRHREHAQARRQTAWRWQWRRWCWPLWQRWP